jgi:diguanylate cyclase (GGDEF)-like protein
VADHPPPAATLVDLAGRLLADAEQRVPLRQVLGQFARMAVGVLQVDGAAVSLVEDDRLRLLDATAPELEALEGLQARSRGGPARRAVEERRTVVVDDLRLADSSDADSAWAGAARAAGWGSCLVVPVVGRARLWALLSLYGRSAAPSEELRRSARALADLLAAMAVLIEDRDVAIRAQQALAHQALHDSLTGLANRTLLLDRLTHELLVAARRRTPLAVLFVDLDRFKEVNDTLGHAAGDELLVEVARRLTGVLRAQDTVARLGGDEFVAVCADLPADLVDERVAQHVTALAERLAVAVASPAFAVAGQEVQITASVGSVLAQPGQASAESLLREADAAMYRAKFTGPTARRTIDLRRPPTPAGREP